MHSEVVRALERARVLLVLWYDVSDFVLDAFTSRPLPAHPPAARLRDLKVEETGVCKVVRERAYSSAWHPSEEKLLLAVGDKVWNTFAFIVSPIFGSQKKYVHVNAFFTHGLPAV